MLFYYKKIPDKPRPNDQIPHQDQTGLNCQSLIGHSLVCQKGTGLGFFWDHFDWVIDQSRIFGPPHAHF